MDEKTCVAKLIKAYILNNPRCTSKMISEWLIENDFGLAYSYSPQKVATLIRELKNNPSHRFPWFREIEGVKKNNKFEYYIKRS